MTIPIAIPAEIEDDQQLRWHRKVALERQELHTLRLVLEYERLMFEQHLSRQPPAAVELVRPRELQMEKSAIVLLETDGELRRELRRAVEKGERRELELADLRVELARKTDEIANMQKIGKMQMIGNASLDVNSLELREAALGVAMERLQEREREFEDFVASEERRLEAEQIRLVRKRTEVITREKKLLQSSTSIQLA